MDSQMVWVGVAAEQGRNFSHCIGLFLSLFPVPPNRPNIAHIVCIPSAGPGVGQEEERGGSRE